MIYAAVTSLSDVDECKYKKDLNISFSEIFRKLYLQFKKQEFKQNFR